MAITLFRENSKSRAGTVDASGANGPLLFLLRGTIDRSEAYAYVVANTPAFFENMYRKSIDLNPLGGGVWEITVDYSSAVSSDQAVGTVPADGPGDPPATPPDDTTSLGPSYTFDISGKTVKVTQANETISVTKRGGGAAPDFKGAIGVSKDGVAGCDMFVPSAEFTVDCERSVNNFKIVREKLFAMTGKCNDDTWYGFDVGEVLYMGASCRYTQNGRWSFSHRFSFAKNEVNVPICADLTVPFVGGHDYLWFTYTPSTDAGRFIQLPDVAVVSRLYRRATFTSLGIG